jgi:hypothetical protein
VFSELAVVQYACDVTLERQAGRGLLRVIPRPETRIWVTLPDKALAPSSAKIG